MLGAILAAAIHALRIVSLAPALTEDLYAIGAGPAVVGVDAYSNRPAAAMRIPRIGKFREINAEAILALHPDLVIGIAYQARNLADVQRAGIATATFDINDVAHDLATIRALGKLTGHTARATQVAASIQHDLDTLAARATRKPAVSGFVIIGRAPIYTAGAGSYLDDLLALAHITNIAHDIKSPWPTFSAERLLVADPFVVIDSAPSPPLIDMPWSQLSAVRRGRVIAIPEDDMLRPGPHVADVLRALLAGVDRFR